MDMAVITRDRQRPQTRGTKNTDNEPRCIRLKQFKGYQIKKGFDGYLKLCENLIAYCNRHRISTEIGNADIWEVATLLVNRISCDFIEFKTVSNFEIYNGICRDGLSNIKDNILLKDMIRQLRGYWQIQPAYIQLMILSANIGMKLGIGRMRYIECHLDIEREMVFQHEEPHTLDYLEYTMNGDCALLLNDKAPVDHMVYDLIKALKPRTEVEKLIVEVARQAVNYYNKDYRISRFAFIDYDEDSSYDPLDIWGFTWSDDIPTANCVERINCTIHNTYCDPFFFSGTMEDQNGQTVKTNDDEYQKLMDWYDLFLKLQSTING